MFFKSLMKYVCTTTLDKYFCLMFHIKPRLLDTDNGAPPLPARGCWKWNGQLHVETKTSKHQSQMYAISNMVDIWGAKVYKLATYYA